MPAASRPTSAEVGQFRAELDAIAKRVKKNPPNSWNDLDELTLGWLEGFGGGSDGPSLLAEAFSENDPDLPADLRVLMERVMPHWPGDETPENDPRMARYFEAESLVCQLILALPRSIPPRRIAQERPPRER